MTEKEKRLRLQKEALRLIKGFGDHAVVQVELPGVSKSTLNALEKKGIIGVCQGIYRDDGPDYYYWTGKEIE